ncbi:transcriptional regulator family: Fungal Specific TF [Paecilomyces variotii]|nr:transcriptional regulator family: Fungal Specific TF [Paecilomyces variotii]KAJ9332589.1 transcriptional regulator family: Fungal Specific TF [Paecilomyces variotii]
MTSKALATRRTRDGCWTCRKRKKKCDGRVPACHNCDRLGLSCAGYTAEIVWEDDRRRIGMKRRGPKGNNDRVGSQHSALPITHLRTSQGFEAQGRGQSGNGPGSTSDIPHDDIDSIFDETPLNQISFPLNESLRINPRHLNPKQALLFDRYINRFSRIYPSCQTPSNPFLSILLPMAITSDTILTALLALSGAQTWGDEWDHLQQETLRAKQRTIEICRKTLSNIHNEISSPQALNPTASADLLCLVTCVTIMLIYEKLSGEDHQNWKPHLDFISHIFNNAERIFSPQYRSSEHYRFLLHMFAYNDLVASTSLRMRTLSWFYTDMTNTSAPTATLSNDEIYSDQYYYPSLIARINIGDQSVTLSHISNWDGNLNWFPSHCLERSSGISPGMESSQSSDYDIAAEIYRAAAIIHYGHMIGFENEQFPDSIQEDNDPFHYHRHAIQLLNLLPAHSPVGNILLWPISIIAPDLMSKHVLERESAVRVLYGLEKHFQMRHFRRARETLQEIWRAKDCGLNSMAIMQSSILQG